jgi:WD40 repeat protein
MRVWDVTTGREIPTPTPLGGGAERVTHAALSHDGTKLVTAYYDHIRVWDIQTATSAIGSGAHGGSIFPIALSHDGKRIASAGQYDKRVNIWDINKVTVASGPHTDHTSNGDVKSFAFSPDGKKIVMGFDNGKILLIDAKDGDIIDPSQPEKFCGHTGWITSLAFAPDGKWIVSGCLNGSVRVWETDTGLPTCKPLKGHMNGIRSISVSSDGKKIVSNSGEVVLIWVLQ